MSHCSVFIVFVGACIFLASALCYIIGEIVLDVNAISNKNEVYEEITRTDYYRHCAFELGFIAGLFAVFVLFIFISFMPCSPFLTCTIMIPVPFAGIGVTSAVFTILTLVDMNKSHCEEDYNNAISFISNLDWGSFDGQLLQREFINSSNPYDLIGNVAEWVNTTCDKDYDKRARIVGFGCIGFVSFLVAPFVIAMFFIYFCCCD